MTKSQQDFETIRNCLNQTDGTLGISLDKLYIFLSGIDRLPNQELCNKVKNSLSILATLVKICNETPFPE